MNKILTVAAALALLAGCRREDIREFTVDIPGLAESNRAQVVEALQQGVPGNPKQLRFYDGVLSDSLAFDFQKKTLTLKYDSMKIAKTNIRMRIQDKGIEVTFPSNTTGKAGYINSR